MKKLLILLLSTLPAVPLAAQQAGCIPLASGTATVFGSVTTIRPGDAQCGATSARLIAARNEFESFQLVIRAAGTAVPNVNVTVGTLNGPGGAGISTTNATVYREATYIAQVPSDSEGGTGAWPDALIPSVDNFYRERRSAFPVTVPPGENRVAWVDVFVPDGTPPGTYTGAITVSAGGASVGIPLTLTVLNVTLPSTASLTSAFLTHYGRGCDAHTGHFACDWDEDKRWALHALYAQAALDNRLTIANPIPMGINEGPSADQAAQFRKYILPMLRPDAVAFHNEWQPARLRGAQLTSVGLYKECTANCIAAWRALATAAPRFDERMFLECVDEPSSAGDWNTCLAAVDTAAANWPGLATMSTTTIQQARAANADARLTVLAPVINRMHDKPFANSCCRGNQRAQYDAFLARGNTRVWMYTSNMSYSSDDSVDPYWDGWAGYAIDQPASQSRAMGWLSFEYDVTGELYYATTERLPQAWTAGGLYELGGNGDGTLFYPGTPAAIGGTRDIPLESIRMKRIRDGREDYEYLRLLADKGQRAFAQSVARELFPSTYQTTVTQDVFDAARQSLINKIVELTAPTTPTTPAPPEAPVPAIPSLSPATVNLAVTTTASGALAVSPARELRLTLSGNPAAPWTASASSPWVTISPASGRGSATLTASVSEAAGSMPAGPLLVTVTVNSGVNSASSSVLVTRLANGMSAAPVGLIDTPLEGAAGVAGALAVTGWALDDVGVRQVRILRDPVAGEGTAAVPIGTAVFVDGSRPDVAAGYELPQNTRAGWGLMVLTNFLPNGGNGTFRLIAIADDLEGNSTILGTRIITCGNAASLTPFGTIDAPAQGETISGSAYNVFGWVLSRGPALAHPPYGSVSLVIDGVILESPYGWTNRPDLSALFPADAYPGISHALGVVTIDTTQLADGIHTMSWLVTADDGRAEGIGSRYFLVNNSGVQASARVAAPHSPK